VSTSPPSKKESSKGPHATTTVASEGGRNSSGQAAKPTGTSSPQPVGTAHGAIHNTSDRVRGINSGSSVSGVTVVNGIGGISRISGVNGGGAGGVTGNTSGRDEPPVPLQLGKNSATTGTVTTPTKNNGAAVGNVTPGEGKARQQMTEPLATARAETPRRRNHDDNGNQAAQAQHATTTTTLLVDDVPTARSGADTKFEAAWNRSKAHYRRLFRSNDTDSLVEYSLAKGGSSARSHVVLDHLDKYLLQNGLVPPHKTTKLQQGLNRPPYVTALALESNRTRRAPQTTTT
jgi:hypothetical protein